MRILSVYFPNRKYTSINSQNNRNFASYNNSLSDFKSIDTVSFKSRAKLITDLRNIPDIPCACCGVTTIPNGVIDKFMEEKIYYSARKAMDVIESSGVFCKSKLNPHQLQAYKFCKMISRLYEGTLSSILDRPAVVHKMGELSKDVVVDIKLIEKMTKRVFHDSSYLIKELEQFEPKMNKVEKEAFNILRKYSKIYPKKSFTEIFNEPKLFNKHLLKLERKQGNILWQIDCIAENMSTPSKQKIRRLVKKSYNIILKESFLIKNKRSRIIEMFENIDEKIPERELMQEILFLVNQLPSSKNSVSAFIVKYRDYNPNKIAERILRGSAATIEHVKPARRVNDPGENEIKNYIVLCANCNSERGQIPYSEFIKTHRDMPHNIQKYIEKVIEYINNGRLNGYGQYPQLIRQRVIDESEGKIKLDISSLNLRNYVQKNKNRK